MRWLRYLGFWCALGLVVFGLIGAVQLLDLLPDWSDGVVVDVRAVAVSVNEAELTWTVTPASGTQAVVIERDAKPIAQVEATARRYVDTGLKPEQVHSYELVLLNERGRPVARSGAETLQLPNEPEAPDSQAPTPPQDFSVTATHDGLLLSWSDAVDDNDVTAYRIYRDDEPLITVNGHTLSYLDRSGEAANEHHYVVEAIDVVGHRSDPARVASGLDEPAGRAVGYAPELRRYPYLTDVVDRYATVNWATDRSVTSGFVKWGRVGSDGSCNPTNVVAGTRTPISVNKAGLYQWKALLDLEPDTQYCYRVVSDAIDLLGGDPSPTFWTQIPVDSTEPFSFVVFGDWGSTDEQGENAYQASLMQLIATSGARFAFTVGDNGDPVSNQKSAGDLIQNGPGESGIFGPEFWTVPGRSISLFPAVGNHDMASMADAHPYLVNWPQDRAVSLSGGRYARESHCCNNGTEPADYPSAWYAFNAGPTRFYVLTASWADSNVGAADLYKNDYDAHWTPTSDEYQWLKQDLEAHPNGLKFVMLHFPFYSDSFGQKSDTYLQGSGSLEGLLASHGVDIAFSGHTHLYERNHAQLGGLTTYITGGGGARLAAVNSCSGFDAFSIGWSVSKNQGNGCNTPAPPGPEQVHHFLLVTVDGNTVTVTPTNSTGQTFDVMTYTVAAERSETP